MSRQTTTINLESAPVGLPLLTYILLEPPATELSEYLHTLLKNSGKEIEVLFAFVDPADSAKSSLAYQKYANWRTIGLPRECANWQKRKIAAGNAGGKYLVFLCPDEIPYSRKIQRLLKNAHQCDLVVLEQIPDKAQRAPSLESAEPQKDSQKNNEQQVTLLKGHERLEALCVKREISQSVAKKIISTSLCRQAYEEIERHNLMPGEALESLAWISKAKNVLTLSSVPCIRSWPGAKGESGDKANNWRHLKKYLGLAGLNNYRNNLLEMAIESHVRDWLKMRSAREITSTFNRMADAYGINQLIATLANRFAGDWRNIADVFQYYLPRESGKNPHSIGILLEELGNGGTERVTLDMAKGLAEKGYKITLYLKKPNANDHNLPDGIKAEYIPLNPCEGSQILGHISALEAILNRNDTGVMLMPSTWSNLSIWEIILLKYKGIGVITHNHMPFTDPLITSAADYTLMNHASTLRCADKHICLSPYSELYCRIMGIDARYIANPIRRSSARHKGFQAARNNIIVFGRIGDRVKRVADSLEVIAKVATHNAKVKGIFIGPLASPEERKAFSDKARELDILDKVNITGWIADPTPYLLEAGVLLCTSHEESFSLTICEAQSIGVPCVMYDLPIMPAENNEGIIKVPHGDNEAAAAEIGRLLTDEAEWLRRSAAGQQKMLKFSPELFIDNIMDLLATYKNSSVYKGNAMQIYEPIIWALNFYSRNRGRTLEEHDSAHPSNSQSLA